MKEHDAIAEVLKRAQAAVDAAGINDADLKQIAFKEAIALAASGAGMGVAAEKREVAEKRGDAGAPAGPLESIAKRLGITVEEADRIFHIEDDNLEMTVPVSAIASAKKTATQEIAILVTAGRQAAGIDERETDADVVRAAASHYKKLDVPNFSSTIRDLNGVLTVRERGRKKYLKMTQPGWEDASKLASRILGKGE